ncbi:MAG: ABC transporter substrate-binding protein [Lachnospiraceae bacterium]|nr:ABC transporter substrate-binding protein [Lachnospiraceae bacterium]
MKKRTIALTMAALFTAASLMAGCGQNADTAATAQTQEAKTEAQTADTTESTQTAESEAATAAAGETYVIGISQFAEHGSLDNCKEGFLEGLKEAGIEEGVNLEVLFDNAQADTSTAGMISDSYVSQGVDMICAIATPSAMSAYNSCLNTDIPVIFTAVSDPVGAGLAAEDGTPEGNITGTADTLPVAAQLQMIREVLPEAKTIGILYTTSEANSVSTIETYKELAGEYGFEIVETGITALADVDMAAADIVTKVDCISNLTDNTVVQGLQTVLAKANAAGIPVFGSEVEQVKNGCLASEGIDYIALGKQTGAMAAKVLKGEAKASEISFEKCEGANLYINTKVAADLGITLPENYASDATEVFDEIVVD